MENTVEKEEREEEKKKRIREMSSKGRDTK